MKKIWSYIALFFMGLSAGIVIAAKWISGDEYKAYIRKIRQRGRDNATSTVVFKPTLGSGSISRREERIARREERKNKGDN